MKPRRKKPPMKREKSASAVVVERVPDVELTMRLMDEVMQLQERAYVLLVLQQTLSEFRPQQGRPPLRTVADSHGQRCARRSVCDGLADELFALVNATWDRRNAVQERLMPGSTHKVRPLFAWHGDEDSGQ